LKRTLRPGTKEQVLGVTAAALSVMVAAFAKLLGFAFDPFYFVLGAAGLALAALGTWRKRARR